MTSMYNLGDDTIDSRDLVARLEELRDEKDALLEAIADAREVELEAAKAHTEACWLPQASPGLEVDTHYAMSAAVKACDAAKSALAEWTATNGEELDALTEIEEKFQGYGDFGHGETLINESHFTKYIEDLISDCYEIPKGCGSGEWPYNHMTMNYAAAAEEARADYSEVTTSCGHTYLIRA